MILYICTIFSRVFHILDTLPEYYSDIKNDRQDDWMAIEIFNRKEIKYMLDDVTYNRFISRLEEYMVPDSYSMEGGFYSICNIYYDTADDLLIRRSIQKPVYKEKLRLRSYGVPDGDSTAFVEIKKKYKGIVNKRRVKMTLNEAEEYLSNGTWPRRDKLNAQIMRELDFMRERYELLPKVYLSYDRRAYFDRNDSDFRVTFDTNIRARREDLDLRKSSYGTPLIADGYRLMEVKISGATPTWFTSLLSEFKIYPVSFSKYGTEYRRYISDTFYKGDNTICLNQSSVQMRPQLQPARQC